MGTLKLPFSHSFSSITCFTKAASRGLSSDPRGSVLGNQIIFPALRCHQSALHLPTPKLHGNDQWQRAPHSMRDPLQGSAQGKPGSAAAISQQAAASALNPHLPEDPGPPVGRRKWLPTWTP